MKTIYNFKVIDIDGKEVELSKFTGKVLLVVNTASKCGFTKQYSGLEELYEKYNSKGFEVLGFPCNQFKSQDPGDEQQIKSFCSLTYNVKFPMFAKIDVNGKNAAPLYQYLKKECKGVLGSQAIKWNFTKFLINKDGEVIKRFAPITEPSAIEEYIQGLLI